MVTDAKVEEYKQNPAKLKQLEDQKQFQDKLNEIRQRREEANKKDEEEHKANPENLINSIKVLNQMLMLTKIKKDQQEIMKMMKTPCLILFL